jgi:hypothetical protein
VYGCRLLQRRDRRESARSRRSRPEFVRSGSVLRTSLTLANRAMRKPDSSCSPRRSLRRVPMQSADRGSALGASECRPTRSRQPACAETLALARRGNSRPRCRWLGGLGKRPAVGGGVVAGDQVEDERQRADRRALTCCAQRALEQRASCVGFAQEDRRDRQPGEQPGGRRAARSHSRQARSPRGSPPRRPRRRRRRGRAPPSAPRHDRLLRAERGARVVRRLVEVRRAAVGFERRPERVDQLIARSLGPACQASSLTSSAAHRCGHSVTGRPSTSTAKPPSTRSSSLRMANGAPRLRPQGSARGAC